MLTPRAFGPYGGSQVTSDARPAPTDLPIEACIDDLRAALGNSGAAVLQAEPGAGKTTVVPIRLMDEAFLDGENHQILMLEPRRLAARAAAHRMAAMFGESVGKTVGYVTRDDRRTSAATRIEVVTEGILTRRLQNDPELSGVGLVIFDEFHERSLQADLGLALTLDVRRSIRPDLAVLVMSATLDTEAVAGILDDAPVIESPGRTFPIDIRWRPRAARQWLEPAMNDAIRLALGEPGDVLAFLPGAAAINRTAKLLGGVASPDGQPVDVRRLFGALAAAEQDAAISPSPSGRRRVVLSTGIAETSLTVAGVRTVVDGGQVREPRFDPRTGMTRLVTVPNSRASADQRAGRAGRTAPGVAIRLWSKIEHGARPPFTGPEISRVDLTGLLLELGSWGVTDPESIPFLDQPPSPAIAEGRELLRLLGAIDAQHRLTVQGHAMARLPLHPRLARMVVTGSEMGLGPLACAIAALIEDRDILRGRPDEVPVDLAVRLDLLADHRRHHPSAHGPAVKQARDRARDLQRRAGVKGDLDLSASGLAGAALSLAYPDRIAQQRASSNRETATGRYRLRTGGGAQLSPSDPLAQQPMLVVADLDGKRNDARIRLAASVDQADIEVAFSDDITNSAILVWDEERDDLVARVEHALGSIQLSKVERRPDPDERTHRALLRRVAETRLDVLRWTKKTRALQDRLRFLHDAAPNDWPDISDQALLGSLEEWLLPFLDRATGRKDLERIDLSTVLWNQIGYHRAADVERLAPEFLDVPNGRPRPVDYSGERPVMRARVQQMFGTTVHPTVCDGTTLVVVELLSPADRPIQITSDLPGFWDGSWSDVRKDLAGRYPKHKWPLHPNE